MLEAVADLLSPTHANIDGWLSIQIDPNEDDSSVLVREIENFILDAMSTADIRCVQGNECLEYSKFQLNLL